MIKLNRTSIEKAFKRMGRFRDLAYKNGFTMDDIKDDEHFLELVYDIIAFKLAGRMPDPNADSEGYKKWEQRLTDIGDFLMREFYRK